jgi:hypothetical protein
MRKVLPVSEAVKDAVVRRVCDEASIPAWKAGVWFDEMLKFLALNDEDGNLHPVPSRPVDVAWHNFILLTRPYSEYCELAFGTFLHHDVDLEAPVAEEHDGGEQLDHYRATRQTMRHEFGSIDPEIWPDAVEWTTQQQRFEERGLCDMGEVVHPRFYIDPSDSPLPIVTAKVQNFGGSEAVLVASRRLLDRAVIPVIAMPAGWMDREAQIVSGDLSVVANLSTRPESVRIGSDTGVEKLELGPASAIGFDPRRVTIVDAALLPMALAVISYGGF